MKQCELVERLCRYCGALLGENDETDGELSEDCAALEGKQLALERRSAIIFLPGRE